MYANLYVYCIIPDIHSQSFTAKRYFAMYTVGKRLTMKCTRHNGITRMEWLQNGTLVLTGTGSQLVLQQLNTDSIHHNLFTCRRYTNSGSFDESNITAIVIGK